MELLETLLHSFVNLAMLLFEYIGVGVITYAGIQGLVNYVRKAPDTRLVLAQGLAMGLEFKLGSEILRTVVVRSLSEIAIVGSIIYKACVALALSLGLVPQDLKLVTAALFLAILVLGGARKKKVKFNA